MRAPIIPGNDIGQRHSRLDDHALKVDDDWLRYMVHFEDHACTLANIGSKEPSDSGET